MPLDNSMDQCFDPFNSHCIGWQKVFVFLPKRCHLTNKLIWLNFGYIGTAMWTGPGEPVYEHRWIKANEFLFAKLKGII